MATKAQNKPRPSTADRDFYNKLCDELSTPEGEFSANEKGYVTFSEENLVKLAQAVNRAAIEIGNVGLSLYVVAGCFKQDQPT